MGGMKFRKKPMVIEAVKFKGTFASYNEICEFCEKSLQNNHCGQEEPQEIYINTLEGTMTASKNDWIIKGINGEFYPCKPDIFERIYDVEKGETMKPTIGRVVWYMKYGTPNGEHKAEPSPAIITKVNDEANTCSLFVMNPNGCYFNETPYSEELKPGHWSWPPRV